jgi:protein LTV1
MDDFLARYEVIGGKFRHVLDPLNPSAAAEGFDSLTSNNSKLDRVRGALAGMNLGEEVEGEDPEVTARRREKERILKAVERQDREEASKKKKDRMPMINIIEDQQRDRWDCETVLSAFSLSLLLPPSSFLFPSPFSLPTHKLTLSSFVGTYSNLSNHPRMLRLRDSMGKKKTTPSASSSAPIAQIKLDPKTGFPTVNGVSVLDERPNKKGEEDVIMEEDEDEDEEEYGASFLPLPFLLTHR